MSKQGVPYGGIALTAAVAVLGVILNAVMPADAFEIVLNVASLGIISSWGMIVLCQLALHRLSRKGLAVRPSFRMFGAPYTGYLTLAFLLAAYDEEEVKGETRVVLRLHRNTAPVQVAVMPLSKKEELIGPAREVLDLVRPHFRVEGTLAVLVVAAAAILAAFPIPPSRLVEEEASRQATPSASALPRPGALTMGSHAGQVLVGLTLRPGLPGPNQVVVYLLPLEGNTAAGGLKATLVLSGNSVALESCGDACRRADVSLQGDQSLSVDVAGPKGGTASFDIPKLPAPDGAALLQRAQARIHQLRTYRLFETLSSGLATIPAQYAFQAPNRMESSVNGQSQAVWIGGTRYLKETPGAAWQVQPGGPSIPVPSFIWDYFKPFVDPRVVGVGRIDGVSTTVVAFAGGQRGTPIWFRLWVDPTGLVRRAEMRAPGHFMDDRYYDFDATFTISAPTG